MDQLTTEFISYIPQILGAITIIVVGVLLAFLARQGAVFLLHRLRFDEACERLGVARLLGEAGISKTPSQFSGVVVFYAIIFFSVLAALGPLGLEFLASTLNQILLYAPRLLVAALIVLFGTSGGRLLAELSRRGLESMGVRRAGWLAPVIQFSVIFIAAVLALAVLGIDVAILIVVTVIGFGAVALTASLALGLGLRQLSQNIAAGRYIAEGIREGDRISIDGLSGTVEHIGHAMTTVRDARTGRVYLLPNSHFMESVVEKEER